jgi:hypothetical protein
MAESRHDEQSAVIVETTLVVTSTTASATAPRFGR